MKTEQPLSVYASSNIISGMIGLLLNRAYKEGSGTYLLELYKEPTILSASLAMNRIYEFDYRGMGWSKFRIDVQCMRSPCQNTHSHVRERKSRVKCVIMVRHCYFLYYVALSNFCCLSISLDQLLDVGYLEIYLSWKNIYFLNLIISFTHNELNLNCLHRSLKKKWKVAFKIQLIAVASY